MRYRVFDDPFKDRQPQKTFIGDLTRPVHQKMPVSFSGIKAKAGELKLSKVCLKFSFPDPEGLLETSYKDFYEFLSAAGIKTDKGGTPIVIEKGDTPCFEAYKISVTKDGVKITANDTEGVRRALIYIEDQMMRLSGTVLPLGVIERKPFLKTRISRCFFSPPSHNENDGMKNELEDDIDYYPDGYLNRLMHDGINGLWIGANFRDLLKSEIFPEYGKDGERRLNKLKSIAIRCKRYGIGVYLFSVEPASTYRNPALSARKDLLGGTAWGGKLRLFCSSTDEFKQYIKESLTSLFAAIPDLKGFINITVGEALSGCGSTVIFDCPRCKEKYGTHGKTLAATEKMFASVMKEVAPNAEFISWTYAQRSWRQSAPKAFEESLLHRDTGVIHMQNFEDEGRAIQLGKERKLFDYWLSFVGPGKIMADTLKVNKARGIKTYAKLQVCSSFDFGSIPYVPVPGILFDKFKYMRENGISGAMLCWYTGNYPGLMNKAACELSFYDDFSSKEEFLDYIAKTYWGKDYSPVAKAFSLFEKGYKNYPLNKAFLWFSPFVDAPCAPLRLLPVDLPMPSSWKITEPSGGDRIGEALLDGHTLEEAQILVQNMLDEWEKGLSLMPSIIDTDDKNRIDQIVIAKAIGILIESGLNQIKFYVLRRLLGINKGDPFTILDQMEQIARREIEVSKSLIPLCDNYPYLGYMTEANGYKFFTQKLLWRIETLRELIEKEFNIVKQRLNKGLSPLAFYSGEEEGSKTVKISTSGEYSVPVYFESENDCEPHTAVCSFADGDKVYIRFTLCDSDGDVLTVKPEFRLMHPSAPFTLSNGKVNIGENVQYGLYGKALEQRIAAITCKHQKNENGEIYTLCLSRRELGQESREPFRLAVERKGKHAEKLGKDDRSYVRLILGEISPDSYVFFIE